MGIDSLWPLLDKVPVRYSLPKDLFQPPPSTTSSSGCLYYPEVDLFASHLPEILDLIHKERQHNTTPVEMGEKFGRRLLDRYPVPSVTNIHMDGAPTLEKQQAHENRHTTKKKERERLQDCLDVMERRSNLGKLTPTRTMTEIRSLLRRLFSMDLAFKEAFLQGLKRVFPDSHICQTEADTCIAGCSSDKQVEGQVWERIVVSNDSDMLVYPSVKSVLRKMPRGGDYGLYPKTGVVRMLNMPSENHLTILGVVCKNDYTSNLPEHGISTNMAILRRYFIVSDPRTILNAYQEYVHTYLAFSPGYFEPAFGVFVDLTDTPLPVNSNTNPSAWYLEQEDRFRELKERRYRVRKEIKLTQQGGQPRHHVPPRAVPNRFRPVFAGATATLTGKTIEDITTTTPRDHPPKKPRPPKSLSANSKDKNSDKNKAKDKAKDHNKSKDQDKTKNKTPATSRRPRRLSQATIDEKAIQQKHPVRALSIGSVGGASIRQLNDAYARVFLLYLLDILRDTSTTPALSVTKEDLPVTPLHYRGAVEQAVAKMVKTFRSSRPSGKDTFAASTPVPDSMMNPFSATPLEPPSVPPPLLVSSASSTDTDRLRSLLAAAAEMEGSQQGPQQQERGMHMDPAEPPSAPPPPLVSAASSTDADRLRCFLAAAAEMEGSQQGSQQQKQDTHMDSFEPLSAPPLPLVSSTSLAAPSSEPATTGPRPRNKEIKAQAIRDALHQLPHPSRFKDMELPVASGVAVDIKSVSQFKGFASAVAEWVYNYAMEDSRRIQAEILKAVNVCNRVQMYLYFAVAIFIKALRDGAPLPPCPSKVQSSTGKTTMTSLWVQDHMWRPEDAEFIEKTLMMITEDDNFLVSLATQIYSGERHSQSRGKCDAGFLDSASAAMVAYGYFVHQTGFAPLKPQLQLSFANFASMIAKPVRTSLKNHYSKTHFDTEHTNMALSDISYFFLHNGSTSPGGKQNPTLSDFPKAKVRPGYVYLTEACLIDIIWATASTKNILQFLLHTRLSPLVFRIKQDFQYVHDEYRGIVTEVLFGHGDHKHITFMRNRLREEPSRDYDMQQQPQPADDRGRSIRHWLKGTIITDGLVLNRLAYDASITKSPKQQQQAETEDEDEDTVDNEDGLELIDFAEDELEALSADEVDSLMREAGLSNAEPSTVTSPSGSSSSSSGTRRSDRHYGITEPEPDPPPDRPNVPATAPDPAWTRWTVGTRLLPNVQVTFPTPEACPDPEDAIVIGWDAGERKAAVAVARDPYNPNRRQSVTISRSFLWRPALLFRKQLEKRKTDTKAPDNVHSFAQLEAGIPTFSLQNLDKYFGYIRRPIGSSTTVLESLVQFYEQPWFRRNRWESKKAQAAAIDYAVESVLRMAHRTISIDDGDNGSRLETIRASTWGLDPRLPPIVVCIGLAQFNSKTGLPSKHGTLIRRFVQKAKPLGIIIVGANEFYTSAKCPREDCDCFLESNLRRSKYCRSCKMDFDRDVVGAENISTICLEQLRNQSRPPKFMPPDPPPPPPPPPPPQPPQPPQPSPSPPSPPPIPRQRRPRTDDSLLTGAKKKFCQ